VSLVKFHARNHRQQVLVRGPSAAVDDRATTQETFAPLHERFGFTIDAAASAHNAKLPRYFTVEDDGLAQPWAGERVWCNPPYSDIGPWIEKAWEEHERAELIVLLLPANRTEQTWWQEGVEPYRDRTGSPLRVEFLRGRLRFIASGRSHVGPNERPPFGCCLLIWSAE
jgi:phage N-6-adenine-methyltransferase